jgi:hypothetical protein
MISKTSSSRPARLLRSAVLPLAVFACTHASATQVCLNAGSSAALVFWLENFEDNGQTDEIRLRSGTFAAPDDIGFEFNSFEAKDLTISGGWNAGCSSRRGQSDTVLDGQESSGFYPVNADTSKKADDGQKGVSCPSEESSAKNSSERLLS